MKIDLSLEAVEALTALRGRAKEINEYASGCNSALVSAVLVEFLSAVDTKTLTAISDKLITPKNKRKVLLKKLSQLTSCADTAALEQLERSIRTIEAGSSRRGRPAKNGAFFDEKAEAKSTAPNASSNTSVTSKLP